MKNILLLSDGWRRFIISAWSTGIMQYMKEHGGFSLSEFHSWGNWSHDPEFNKGEYSIFTLPDFSSYDGIIADLTCIQDTIVRSRIAQMIVNSGVPAITLCNQEKGMTCVRSDNYNAVRQLFNHLWTVHGCRRRILECLAQDQISASIGTSYPVLDCPPDQLYSRIEKYIHDADEDMYRCKKIHHAAR